MRLEQNAVDEHACIDEVSLARPNHDATQSQPGLMSKITQSMQEHKYGCLLQGVQHSIAFVSRMGAMPKGKYAY